MERVAEMTSPPVIGRQYLVPCARSSSWGYGRSALNGRWIPIIGRPHEDAEIGVPERHYHYDVRFIGAGLWRLLFDSWLNPKTYAGERFIRPKRLQSALAVTLTSSFVGSVEERRMLCVREMLEFPVGTSPGAPVPRLEPLFAGRRLPAGCRTCPHRGFPLASLPRINGRYVVCSGHGLAWDLETGRMVPRKELEPRHAR